MFIYYIDSEDEKNNRIIFEYVPTIKKLMANALHIKMQRPVGPFKAGDLLYDYSGQTEEGLPKIGYRTNVMFSVFLDIPQKMLLLCLKVIVEELK